MTGPQTVDGVRLTPDGQRYWAMGAGRRVSRPFHYRWLLPLVCGTERSAWQLATRVGVVMLGPATFWYAGGGWRAAAAAAIPYGLATTWFYWRWPVLVDIPALAVAVLAAAAADDGLWPAAIFLAVVAACIKEQGPVFAALYAWHPLLLVGLVPVAVRHLLRAGPDVATVSEEVRWLAVHPFRAGWIFNKKVGWANWPFWFLPWGACLLAVVDADWQVAATAAAGFVTVCLGTDWHRLWVWSFPVLAVAAAHVVAEAWLPFVIVAHFANPFKGEGV